MKKLLKTVALSAATLAFIVPNASVNKAEATGTSFITSDTINVAHNLWASDSTSKTIYSTGGKVKVCGSLDNQGAQTQVFVEEVDEEGNPSETVGSFTTYFYYNCGTIDVSNYVDGTNNKAELKFHFARTDQFQSSKKITFDFYD